MKNIIIVKTDDKNSLVGRYVDTDNLVLRKPGIDIPRGEPVDLYILDGNKTIASTNKHSDNKLQKLDYKFVESMLPKMYDSDFDAFEYFKKFNNNL